MSEKEQPEAMDSHLEAEARVLTVLTEQGYADFLEHEKIDTGKEEPYNRKIAFAFGLLTGWDARKRWDGHLREEGEETSEKNA